MISTATQIERQAEALPEPLDPLDYLHDRLRGLPHDHCNGVRNFLIGRMLVRLPDALAIELIDLACEDEAAGQERAKR
jgi:hypothetical protein